MIRVAAVFVLATAIACASSQTSRSRETGNLITQDEIVAANAGNVYEVIQRLRPQFLRTRGSVSIRDATPPRPVVYVDGMQYGSLDVLWQFPASRIQTIEYIPARDATTRWGSGHMGGVIMLTTKS